MSATNCENQENPHENEDFSVAVDIVEFLLRCKECVYEEFHEKGQMVPITFIPPSKFMKNQFTLL